MDAEFVVAKKYGLFWARMFVDDEVAANLIDGFYIYQPNRFWEPFWCLFERLG